MSTMSATVDNLFGTTPLEGTQAALIKKTYALLTVSLVTAVGGGYIGATSLPLVQFFASPIGWLMAMIKINAVPRIALWASTKNPTLAMLALAADGFLSGIALAPLLWLATYLAPDGHLIPAALGVTGAVFVSVTGYMLTTKQVFSAPRGLMTGMFFALIAAMGLNMFLGLSALATVISIGVGISEAEPGSFKGLHLVVTDIEAARAELVERGIDVAEIHHFGPQGQAPGPDPQRADYGSFASFDDPDGNVWLLQEVRSRAPGR